MEGLGVFAIVVAPACLLLLGWRPYWGIAVLFGLLPIIGILPDLAFVSALATLVGGGALIGALLHIAMRKGVRLGSSKSQNILLLTGILFILWFTITHPYESWQGGSRNWTFTYVQLWVLLWLSGFLMVKEEHQHLLMAFFAGACVILALSGISTATLASTRAESDTFGGANTVARYFVVGFIFVIYLQSIERKKLRRWIMWGALVILVMGVAYTLSRAGIALLILAIGLLSLRILKEGKLQKLMYVIGGVAVLGLLLPSEFWLAMRSVLVGVEFDTGGPRAHLSSVEENIRYELWGAGWRMWLDNPVSGVGIGQFTFVMSSYMPPILSDITRGAHNMYVQVLAETGIVGLILFVALLSQAGLSLYRASRRSDTPMNLAYIWFVAFLILLLGGMLKHDHYDKMLWLFVGVSMTFNTARKPAVPQDVPSVVLPAEVVALPD